MTLSTEDFAPFFEQVWGHGPFDWQSRFLGLLASGSGWPSIVDLPTGSGKSSLVDIALFHLAMDPRAPRRIVLVVDRRVLVDQATRRARRLLEALTDPAPDTACGRVAAALRSLTRNDPDAPLLQTTTLRGAMLRDDAWARRPDVPVLAASTVDQIGSRMLFRGYGVSDSMKPVHAGLVGCDTLLLLDEVHLARPFAESLAQLESIRAAQGSDRPDLGTRRTRVVTMSATPGESTGSVPFGLDEHDRTHPILHRRLHASKATRLESVRVRARDEEPTKRQALARAAVDAIGHHLAKGRRAMAIIVNRVDTARRAHQLATKSLGEHCDVYLLTGRMRPLDQRALLDEVLPRLEAGRAETDDRPIVLVTTQCIEAGADLDLDGLVTECASLDALRQRCGRVDRRGERPDSTVTVLIRSDQMKSTDPIYGDALAATWNWMESVGEDLDFGIDALDALLESHPPDEPLAAPHRDAPVLVPGWLDLWMQTRPRPHPDPDPALFLHGIPKPGENVAPDVHIIWRADVHEDRMTDTGEGADSLIEAISTVPPGSLEAMSVPIWAAKRFLDRRGDAGDVADVEGQSQVTERPARDGRRAVAWRGPDSRIVSSAEVKPGDTLVVPSTYGGMTEKTWNPDDTDPVTDLGDAVQLEQRGRPVLRLAPEVLAPFVEGELPRPSTATVDPSPVDDARAWLDRIVFKPSGRAVPRALPIALQLLRSARRCRIVPRLGTSLEHSVFTTTRPLTVDQLRDAFGGGPGVGHPDRADMDSRLTSEGDLGSFTNVEVGLDDHLAGVEAWASRFTHNCGIPDDIARSIELAAALHDAGKADRRFQLWLHGGDPIRAGMAPEPLAKSGGDPFDTRGRRRARAKAGYPQGQRHELVSLDMLERNSALRSHAESIGADWDLVLHLVASHHGWCRPAAPVVDMPEEDDEPVDLSWRGHALSGRTRHERASYGSGVPARFFRMANRYGAHELAWFEAILRLADHRRSESEQNRPTGETP